MQVRGLVAFSTQGRLSALFPNTRPNWCAFVAFLCTGLLLMACGASPRAGTVLQTNTGPSPSSPSSPASQHSVDLSWDASTSQGVVGYNVYRSTTAGAPSTKINDSLVPSTSYTDKQVDAGQMYNYVVTALNAGGVEGSNSNEITVTVPSP